jgi:hypothetical protein
LSDTTGRLDFFLEVGVGVEIEIGTGVIEVIEIIGFGYKEGFKTGTTLNELSDIIGRIEDFFSKAGAGAGAGARVGAAIGSLGLLGSQEFLKSQR